MPSSQLVHRNQHCGNKLFCFPFLHPFPRLCRQLKWLWDSKSFQTRWVQDIFWMLYFPFPWFFRPLCVGAAKSFASYQLLSNSLQQYPMKGNSESDVIVTTTCIGVIKCSCGVSKKTKQNKTQSWISVMGWKLLSLHSREQHALLSAKFGLNSIAYPCSSVSHPNASLVKKTPGCGKNVQVCSQTKWKINKTLCLSVNTGCYLQQTRREISVCTTLWQNTHLLQIYIHASFAHKT